MKLLPYLLFILVFDVFAQGSDRGGHDGSGGNICYVENYSLCNYKKCTTITGYRLVEEFQYPQYSSHPSFVKMNPIRLKLKASEITPSVNFTDLTQTEAGRRARNAIITAFKFDQELTDVMLGFFGMLKMTYVTQNRFNAAYDVGLEKRSYCVPGTIEAAIRTNLEGTIVLSESSWHKLPIESQTTLLIHETLRFAQLYTNWFKVANNQELQRLTMLVSSKRKTAFRDSKAYRSFIDERNFYNIMNLKKYKDLLRVACNGYEEICEGKIGIYTPENVISSYNLVIQKSVDEANYSNAIRVLLMRARMLQYSNASSSIRRELETMNSLRISTVKYREDIEQKILIEFSKP